MSLILPYFADPMRQLWQSTCSTLQQYRMPLPTIYPLPLLPTSPFSPTITWSMQCTATCRLDCFSLTFREGKPYSVLVNTRPRTWLYRYLSGNLISFWCNLDHSLQTTCMLLNSLNHAPFTCPFCKHPGHSSRQCCSPCISASCPSSSKL
jgi:hypothetical protein